MGFWKTVGLLAKPFRRKKTETVKQQLVKEGKLIAGGAAIGAAALTVAAFPAAAATFALKAAKAVIPKTIKGKVATVTVGLLAAYSPKVAKTLYQAPKTYVQAVKTTAEVIEGEKPLDVETVKEITKTTGIIAGVGAVGLGAGYVAEKIWKRKKKKPEAPLVAPAAITAPTEQLIPEKPVGITGETPITPETTTITTGKKRYKRRRAPKPQVVKQSVRVNVISRSTSTGIKNTNYLRERILA